MSDTPNYTLVTGASGFVGLALVKSLAGRRPLICMSRHQPDVDAPYLSGQFHSFEDLRGLDQYQIDSVVHLAAVTGGCTEEEGLAVNVQGTRRLIRYLLDRGCRKFVLASSVAAVGCLHQDFVPLALPIPDDHRCLARDAYGLSKALMEETTLYFQRANPDTEFINLRFGAVVDDATWEPPRINADQPTPYPFVMLARVLLSDVLRGVTAALESAPRPGVHVYNLVGPDAPCAATVPAVLRASSGPGLGSLDLSRYEQEGHEFDALYDMQKIRRELGFTPQNTTR
jgi:UDP-glucose 4-epimerase